MRYRSLAVIMAALLAACAAPDQPTAAPLATVEMVIEVASATPASTSTTIKPTETRRPTATVAATVAPKPSATPQPSATKAATSTTAPTKPPAPTRTLAPIVATNTPAPIVPTNTPVPIVATDTPLPEPTWTWTPEPQQGNCDPAYPDFCIPPPPPDLNCPDVAPHKKFRVLPPDPHGFDKDGDGVGCES